MKTLDRYIAISVAKGYLIVLLVLAPVFSLLQLVEQLDDVGKGRFQAFDAFAYVFLTLPGRMLELAPTIALMGSVVALGLLARGSELIAMQASGISISRLAMSVLKTGLALMVAVALLGEFAVPELDRRAERDRLLSVSKTGDVLSGEGYWSRDGLSYLNVGGLLHGRIPTDIDIYEFDRQGQLVRYVHAEQAEMQSKRRWKLLQVTEKRLESGTLTTRQLPELTWKPFKALIKFGRLELPAQSLSPSNLYDYVKYLRRAGENTDRYELLFWQKVALPFSTGAMVLLSLPFVFGTLRSASFGLRIVLGLVGGLVFYLLSQIVVNAGAILGVHPAVVALAPMGLVVLIAWLLLRRLR